jgi:hypothetical protein
VITWVAGGAATADPATGQIAIATSAIDTATTFETVGANAARLNLSTGSLLPPRTSLDGGFLSRVKRK